MDLKAYYRKIRETEAAIEDEFPVVRSLPTEAGGRAGKLTETPRAVAARMLVNGVAELAAEDEVKAFRQAAKETQQREEERRRAAQIQFNVVTEDDLRAMMRSSNRGRKE